MLNISPLILLIFPLFQKVTGAPWTKSNQLWNVNFNPVAHDPQQYFGQSPFLNSSSGYFPSPQDWRSHSIYQLITDRFSDGSPKNNVGPHFNFDGFDLRHVNTRHGGDFLGVKNKLPYIKSLGYSAIWVSPVFQNMENSYHSYAQIDFTLFDDRFGTLEEFRDLVKAAHNLGIRIIVDIVVNHMADLFKFESTTSDGQAPFHMHLAEYRMSPHSAGRKYWDFHVDNHFDASGRFGPVFDDLGQRLDDAGPFTGSFWNSDFHHNGDLRETGYGNPWNNHLGKIYGLMDDLRTTHPRVVQKLIAMTNALITSTDIDGIRIDTPMQVPLSFFQQWIPAVRKHAAALGKGNFGVWGEFYCSRERASTMVGRGLARTYDPSNGRLKSKSYIGSENLMDGGVHYPLYYWFMDSVKDQRDNVGGLMDLFQRDKHDYDFVNPFANSQQQYRHLNFFGNHDQWRLSVAPDGLKKTDLASAIIAFWPGIPLLYYGDEQGFNTPGSALDGWAREDFMTSLAWRHPADPCTGTSPPINPATADSFDQTNPHFIHVQKVMNLRRHYWNLGSCDDVYERWHQSDFRNGLYGYTRACGHDETDFVLVLFNTWRDALVVPPWQMYSGWSSAGAADDEIWNVFGEHETNAMDGKTTPKERYKLDKRGHVVGDLRVDGYGVKVFVKSGGYKPLSPTVTQISPAHDHVVKVNKVRGGENNTVDVQIKFSHAITTESLSRALFINGVPLNIVFPTGTEHVTQLKFQVPGHLVQRGMNRLIVTENATSVEGKPFHGNFETRFKVGNAERNVLINGCLNFKKQDGLISSAEWLRFPAVLSFQGSDTGTGTTAAAPVVPFGLRCMKNSGIRGETGWYDPEFYYLQSNKLRLTLKHAAEGASLVRVRFGIVKSETSFPKSTGNNSIVVEASDLRLDKGRKKASLQSHISAASSSDGSVVLPVLEGPWSEWTSYASQTTHELTAEWRVDAAFCNHRVGTPVPVVDTSNKSGGGVKIGFDLTKVVISVQYYVDGSSAYLVYGGFEMGQKRAHVF